jgi:uncharacterized BrkB/YihY/UPF0761 family membrane protein
MRCPSSDPQRDQAQSATCESSFCGLRAISRKRNLTFVAAGAAFNAFLAIPPTLSVLASLWLLIFDPLDVQRSVRPVEHDKLLL